MSFPTGNGLETESRSEESADKIVEITTIVTVLKKKTI